MMVLLENEGTHMLYRERSSSLRARRQRLLE